MDPLDDLLKSYANEPLPPPPSRLNAGVWSEIEHRQAQRRYPFFEWTEFLARPSLAAVALIMTIFVGLAPGVLVERAQPRRQLARETLHLDVFSSRSTALRASFFPALTAAKGSR